MHMTVASSQSDGVPTSIILFTLYSYFCVFNINQYITIIYVDNKKHAKSHKNETKNKLTESANFRDEPCLGPQT